MTIFVIIVLIVIAILMAIKPSLSGREKSVRGYRNVYLTLFGKAFFLYRRASVITKDLVYYFWPGGRWGITKSSKSRTSDKSRPTRSAIDYQQSPIAHFRKERKVYETHLENGDIIIKISWPEDEWLYAKHLHEVKKMTYPEIADILGRTTSSVASKFDSMKGKTNR